MSSSKPISNGRFDTRTVRDISVRIPVDACGGGRKGGGGTPREQTGILQFLNILRLYGLGHHGTALCQRSFHSLYRVIRKDCLLAERDSRLTKSENEKELQISGIRCGIFWPLSETSKELFSVALFKNNKHNEKKFHDMTSSIKNVTAIMTFKVPTARKSSPQSHGYKAAPPTSANSKVRWNL